MIPTIFGPSKAVPKQSLRLCRGEAPEIEKGKREPSEGVSWGVKLLPATDRRASFKGIRAGARRASALVLHLFISFPFFHHKLPARPTLNISPDRAATRRAGFPRGSSDKKRMRAQPTGGCEECPVELAQSYDQGAMHIAPEQRCVYCMVPLIPGLLPRRFSSTRRHTDAPLHTPDFGDAPSSEESAGGSQERRYHPSTSCKVRTEPPSPAWQGG